MAEQGADPVQANAEEEVSMELEATPMAMTRPREEEQDPQKYHNDDVSCKKQQVEEEKIGGSYQNGVEKSVEEARLDSIEGQEQHEKNYGGSENEGEKGEEEKDEEEEECGGENDGGGDDGNDNE